MTPQEFQTGGLDPYVENTAGLTCYTISSSIWIDTYTYAITFYNHTKKAGLFSQTLAITNGSRSSILTSDSWLLTPCGRRPLYDINDWNPFSTNPAIRGYSRLFGLNLTCSNSYNILYA